MKLDLELSQSQILSPQLIQSLEVLQMNAQELAEYLEQLTLENPVVELLPVKEEAPVPAGNSGEMAWLAANDRQNRWYHRQDAVTSYSVLPDEEQGESLADYILQQISTQGDPMLERAVRLLAESLDPNGYLNDALEFIAPTSSLPLPVLQQALTLIQQAEPAGIGARDLKECLLIQHSRQNPDDTTTRKIIEDYLSELAKSHFHLIARALGISQEEVRRSLTVIRSYDPRPGHPFAPPERTVYITPDILVIPGPNGLELMLNERDLPQLNISDYYVRLLKESSDPEVRDYLDSKVRQAKWTVSAIHQRRDTVLRCMQAIVRLQRDYFYRGGRIRPMILADVAELAQVHESTVSRAIRGKWLQSPEGIVPISKFFSQKLNAQQGSCSVDEARRMVKNLIMEEDPSHPLTDQRICELLANRGCPLARRTVAKYRSEMGYPPATGRKR